MVNLTCEQGNTLTLVGSKIRDQALVDQSYCNSQMLVFVDRSLKDIEKLINEVQPKAEVILIDPQQDGIEQVTQIITQRTAIKSIHLVAHGSPGFLQLGLSKLSLDNLDRYANQLQAWSHSLRGASLLIYGCQVACGQKGINFLERLHELTGANIAASTEKVGSKELGGNWQLEYQIGEVSSELAFLPSVRETYSGIFASYDESVDGDISDSRFAPLSFQGEEGTNSITATTSEDDLEYVTLNIPDGLQLDSVVLASYVSEDAVAFAAVQSGTTFTEPSWPTSAITVSDLLGWSHFGTGQVGTDILDNIGNGSGAIGFTAPLPSGDYTFWLQQLGEPTTYTLNFNISSSEDEVTVPTVSLQTISGTFDPSDNLLASELVRSLESGASVLTLAFNVEGEIPEGGLVVDVNSDLAFIDYFTSLGGSGFSPGGKILEAIYDPETGEGTGFKFRIDQPNAIVNLRLLNNSEAEGEIPATFTLAPGESYTVDPDANTSSFTLYDTLGSVPAPTIKPEVSFSVDNTALVESEGNVTTLNFELSEAPPPEGVLVYVASPQQFLGEFDIFNAEVEGGAFPAPNFSSTGFFFKILDQQASITLPAFPDDIDEEGEVVTEGIEAFTLSLQQGPGYTISSEAQPVTITIADTPESQLQVSLTASPVTLIESEVTSSVHTFNLSTAPPEGGVTVAVTVTNLGEFDLDSIVVTGGTISGVTADGFILTITEQTATITLPVSNDGVAEGLETATFTVEAGEGYQVNADASTGIFNIVDTPEQVPPPTSVVEPNDILSLATDTNLSSEAPFVSFTTTLDHETINRYPVGDTFLYVDATEDVDLYKVDLKAGDTIKIDTDSNQFGEGRKVDTWLRVFDSTGAALASNDDGAAPDEVFDAEFQSYIEFTAPADGAYYVGVSLYGNGEYDPLTPASGTGNGDLDPNEYGAGEYTVNISLNDPNGFIAEPTVIPPGTGQGPAISLFTVTGTYGSDFDNLGFDIISSGLVETTPEDAGAALNLVLVANGEIPEGGIEVFINSDIALPDYFGGVEAGDYNVAYGGNLNGKPFSRGGQFLDAVYDENGKATGFKFLIEEPFATITLNPSNREEAETDGPETATFSIVESAGYTLSPVSSSTVTFYDTVEQVPVSTTIPEVSLEIEPTELIESDETTFTFKLTLSEPPPPEGVQVYVSGNAQDFLNELTVFEAEFTGGVPISDGAVSGFYFQMLAQEATITLPVFNSIDITEGIEQFDVRLVPGAGYTVDPDNNGALLTIKDTPTSQIQVSLSSESGTLIESEGTVATLNLSLSAAPPEDGVTVTVNAPEWIEFDPETVEATGGELIGTAGDSFTFKITDQNATISFAVDDDGVEEGVEQATFTVVEAEGYQVSLEANSVTLTLADTPESAPTSTEESNDTIPTAIATGLTATNTTVSFEGEINQYFAEDAEGNEITVDASEDVDFYSFVLKAGDKVVIDVDSTEYEIEGLVPQRLDSELRLFNAAGEELASNFNGFAPNELFVAGRDPYLEFTATEDGTYYVGVAQWNNRIYDPFTLGSGSGRISPTTGVNVGEYTVDITLTPAPPVVSLTASPSLITEAGAEDVTLSFNVTGTIPEDGLIIATSDLFDPQFDFNFEFEDPSKLSGIEFYDYVESETGEVTVFWKITQPDAFIKLAAFDDNIAEPEKSFSLELKPAEGYTIASEASSATVAITDGVDGIGGPVVGVTAAQTTLTEGDRLTLTFNVDGEIPTEGLEVNVDSDVFGSLGQFAIFDAEGNPLVEYEGIAAFPAANEDASGFSVILTDNIATLSLDVFVDDEDEGTQTLNFAVLDGENYDVDPNQSEFTLTLNDAPFEGTGTPGIDNITGTSANNVIIGLLGADVLTGNGGQDTFVYTSVRDRGDTITDFGADDILDLSQIFADSAYASSDPFNDYVQFASVGANTEVQINPVGDSRSIFRSLVTLENVAAADLSASNFLV